MTTEATPQHLDWPDELDKQLSWHWENQLRPRLEGLSDAEYFWEPVEGCWSVRPRAQAAAALAVGSGPYVIDFAFPEPDPPPVTTIAWRLGHLIVGIFGDRNARYFGGPAISYQSYDYPASADQALVALDAQYQRWIDGVRDMHLDRLAERCREPGFETDSMAALILHIHREVIHHGAEIALLRDLYRTGLASRGIG
jgi:DinB superfamily